MGLGPALCGLAYIGVLQYFLGGLIVRGLCS